MSRRASQPCLKYVKFVRRIIFVLKISTNFSLAIEQLISTKENLRGPIPKLRVTDILACFSALRHATA
jgi:hypothetical protein